MADLIDANVLDVANGSQHLATALMYQRMNVERLTEYASDVTSGMIHGNVLVTVGLFLVIAKHMILQLLFQTECATTYVLLNMDIGLRELRTVR